LFIGQNGPRLKMDRDRVADVEVLLLEGRVEVKGRQHWPPWKVAVTAGTYENGLEFCREWSLMKFLEVECEDGK